MNVTRLVALSVEQSNPAVPIEVTPVSEQNREALRQELNPGSSPPPAAPPPLAPAKVKVEAQTLRTLRHHETCPGVRGKECACAANLELVKDGTFKPLEKKEMTWKEPGKLEVTDELGNKSLKAGLVEKSATLWRVDNGIEVERTKPNPSGSRTAKPITVMEALPPRWVCTRCGWGGRGTSVSHRCDVAAVALATRVATLADGLTDEQKTNGELRLVLWRDVDGIYRLAEELVRDGRIVKTVERDRDGAYGVIEGAVLSAVVDLWS